MFGFRFWFLTGPERNGLVAQHRKHTHNHSKDLDFGFGFLPVLSEMGEIREFRSFLVIQNLNLRTKVHQMLIFFKKNMQNSPNPDQNWRNSDKIQFFQAKFKSLNHSQQTGINSPYLVF
jgi:hypothetical protein